MKFAFDSNKLISLDAEDLAEAGIKKAYDAMLNILEVYVPEPAQVSEVIENAKSLYSVRCGASKYVIYSPDLPDKQGESWARATHAFFRIVNDQLAKSDFCFYAINGGNDLGGIFLTQSEFAAARDSLENETDWPYLPTLDPPWYGQSHP